jgi:creatinine amidohydrolase
MVARSSVRIECLRPAEILARKRQCSLAFLPVGLLEYHGPHLPVGADAINAEMVARETCRQLGRGVVLPTLYFGTERERPEWMLKSLGFRADDWVVGMDFPTALWGSHYCPEHVFGLALATQLDLLVRDGYRVVAIVNGHGAVNQTATLDRLVRHYSRTTDALVIWKLTVDKKTLSEGLVGHADRFETSLMLYYETLLGAGRLVDLSTLPARKTPIRYSEFSIVDGPGFSRTPHPKKIVTVDPRDASAAEGKKYFETIVAELVDEVGDALKRQGLKGGNRRRAS